jgi:hypothetical protein
VLGVSARLRGLGVVGRARTMGIGKKARDRRVVWQWSFKR